MSEPTIFMRNPAIPYEGDCIKFLGREPTVMPFEFTGWRDEQMSWKTSDPSCIF